MHAFQDATDVVRSMEAVLGQYARAMLHISRGYALQEASQLLAVSHGPARQGKSDAWTNLGSGAPDQAETVVARAPEWGAAVPVPVSWRLDREQVWAVPERACTACHCAWESEYRGPEHCGVAILQGESETAVWVYVSSPLGCGLAQLTEAAMLRGTPVRAAFLLHK